MMRKTWGNTILYNMSKLFTKVSYDQCRYTATDKIYLRVHVETVHEGFWHNCEQCDIIRKTALALVNHIRAVHVVVHKVKNRRIKDNVCDFCNKTFCSAKLLGRHRRCHTQTKNGINDNYNCPKCGKRFQDETYIKAHTRKIRQDKDFVCEYCGELFTQKSLLKEHITWLNYGY